MSLQSIAETPTGSSRAKTKIIAGYAAVFGVADLSGDVIERGAFKQSLRDVPFPQVRLLYGHDQDRPIGKWLEICEDDFGLFVKGQIDVATQDGAKCWSLISAGLVDGLSIGFRAREFESRQEGGRILKRLDLREISVVIFPMALKCRLEVQP